jgi:hypothetical protein
VGTDVRLLARRCLGKHRLRVRHRPGDAGRRGSSCGRVRTSRRCLEIIVAALSEAGARPQDVVRTRAYLLRVEDFDDVYRAHAEIFGDVRPATTGVVVASLVDPRFLVEFEAEAVLS